MKEKHESMGEKNRSLSNPEFQDRIEAITPAGKKAKSRLPKSAIREMRALEKSINESCPGFPQNTPDYSPAKQAKKGVVIPKQRKRKFY